MPEFQDRHKRLYITHGPPDKLPRPWLTTETFCIINVQCYSLQGQKPYFSVTVDGRDFGGCCHELVHDLRPDLDPVVALHLSDCDGIPMHAAANAIHWVSGILLDLPGFPWRPNTNKSDYAKQTPEWCTEVLRSHLRTDPQSLLDAVRDGTRDIMKLHKRRLVTISDIRRSTEAIVEGFVEQQLARWKQEADAALKIIDSLKEDRP